MGTLLTQTLTERNKSYCWAYNKEVFGVWLKEEGGLRDYGGLSRDMEKDRRLKIAEREDHET